MKKFNQLSAPISSSRCSAYLRTHGLRNSSSGRVSMHRRRQSQGPALSYHSVFASDTHRSLYYICTSPAGHSHEYILQVLRQMPTAAALWPWIMTNTAESQSLLSVLWGKQPASLLLLPFHLCSCTHQFTQTQGSRAFHPGFPTDWWNVKKQQNRQSNILHRHWQIVSVKGQRRTTLGFWDVEVKLKTGSRYLSEKARQIFFNDERNWLSR